jgi:drug/metabolite transporter (DMT)-like permease
MRMPKHRNATLVALTMLNICLQLASALLLKVAPAPTRANLVALGLVLAAVLLLNGARFATWGALHRRFPISLAYPFSALFFPAVVAMAWFMDEPVGTLQICGALLVMAGVARILLEAETA